MQPEVLVLLVDRTASQALEKCGNISTRLGQTHVDSCLVLCILFL
jgi:hypothetical protein